jgi:hypothetical protein
VRLRLLVAAVVALVGLAAIPAQAGSDIQVSSISGPPGTVVSIARASDSLKGGTEHCTLPVTLKMVPVVEAQDGDLSGGVPFTPPDGTFTVPQVPEGDYAVVVVCGGTAGMDSFPFRVTSVAVTGDPNFTG